MPIKSIAAKIFAKYITSQIKSWSSQPLETQRKVFKSLIKEGRKTKFGKDHRFDEIETFEDFFERIPIQDYEGLKPYIDQVIDGQKDILWPGKPPLLCKNFWNHKRG